MPACVTSLHDGTVIESHSHDLETERRALLRLLAEGYPASMVRRLPDKEFHQYLIHYGLVDELADGTNPSRRDESHPYIQVDMSQCVTCYRCVRICDDVQGQFVWGAFNRGDRTQIIPDSGTTLAASSCVGCGACVDTCPSGALEDKTVLEYGQPESWTRTVCSYCGTGCEMEVGTRRGELVQIKPAQDAPVNRGHLCVKGRYAYAFVSAPDRATEPLLRVDGKWQRVSWEEAVEFIACRLREIIAEHGPDSIGILGSARATNEENYLTQKFARVVIGTNNVDCCARVCHAPTAAAMNLMLGTGAATNSFDDIERATTILVCGCNPKENHPIVGARIKQAVLRGANLIVIDPREIELARYANLHLALRPSSNVPLLNALACTIIEEGLYDREFVRSRVEGLDEFATFVRDYSPERVSATCDVDPETLRRAARLYASGSPALSVHGLGVTEHGQGTEGVMCLVNLALLTGNLGKPGAGINPLRGQNNVQGSAQMGCEPDHLTGYAPIASASASFEHVWHVPVPSGKGMNLMRMMDQARNGRLKALWAIGYDIYLTDPDAWRTAEALGALELVVVQDLFLNETAKQFGTVFLPAASSFEKDGTFMNAERRVQLLSRVIPTVGDSKSDWEIICAVACALGYGEQFAFATAQEIWDEVRQVWPAARGITYDRLNQSGLQWPCPTEDHPGTEVLHTTAFPIGATARLRGIGYRPTLETTDEQFPFLLTTGRTLYQFNAGTMTMRTGNVKLRPTDYLDISPVDARRLNLIDHDVVRVRSRYGEARIEVKLDAAVRPGELFATFHTADVFLNRVTSPFRDNLVDSPEFKVTAVRIENLK